MKYIRILLLTATTALFLTGCGAKITQTADSIDIELGEELNFQVSDCFSSEKPEILDKLVVDTSKVNTDEIGTYEITAVYNNNSYAISVNVQDTTAPTITLKAELPAVSLGDIIKPSDFIEYKDNGECKAYLILDDEIQSEELEITEDLVDLKDIYIVAVDEAGNSTGITVENLSISKVKIAEKLDTQLYVVKPQDIKKLDNEKAGNIAPAELGAYLTVTGKTSNGWYEVKWGNSKGYLPADALSSENPTPEADPNEVYGDNGMTAQEIKDKFNELMGNFDADSALGGGLTGDEEYFVTPDYGAVTDRDWD